VRTGLAAALAVGRNPLLRRVALAYACFIASEYGAWIAILVYAYGHGGASLAGAIALAQLVPAAVVAPLAASIADRRSPAALLLGGYVAQALGLAASAAAIGLDAPALAWCAAVVASTAVVTTRPAQAALTPALVRTAEELTAANAVSGWIESVGIVAAGLVTGVAIGGAGVGWAVGITAALAGAAALLALGARGVTSLGGGEDVSLPGTRELTAGIVAIARNRPARLLVSLLTGAWVVVGAIDILLVVLAVRVLEQGSGWVGYLNTAYGVGGIVASAAAAALVGRRHLSRPIAAGVGIFAAGLAATALVDSRALALVLLAVVGGGRSFFDVATRTLLQRVVPTAVLGRVFGAVEGLAMAGLAVGSVPAPVLVALAGPAGAFAGAALILPVVALLGIRSLRALDEAAHVPVVEIALLRSMPMFRALPGPALEGVAAALTPVPLAAGATLIREGDTGDRFYAIAEGELAVVRRGVRVAVLGRSDGVGEIALLQRIPRTATVTSLGPGLVYALDREPFLVAVTGHAGSQTLAAGLAEQRLAELAELGLLAEPLPGER
jgi:Na+/melibiose symporter-like transporter